MSHAFEMIVKRVLITFLIFIVAILSYVKTEANNGTILTSISHKTQQEKPTVRLIYLIPSDGTYHQDYKFALSNAAKHLQKWYGSQIGNNMSFRLNDPLVEVYQTIHPSDWYNTNPSNEYKKYWFTFNVINDGFALTSGKFFDPNYIYVYYIDVENDPDQYGGSGADGVAVLPQHDLKGLVGEDAQFTDGCRWIGGLGHELGHALKLGHPPKCDSNPSSPSCPSIMSYGLYNYPNTFFIETDKEILLQSPFIQSQNLGSFTFSCKDLINPKYLISIPYVGK